MEAFLNQIFDCLSVELAVLLTAAMPLIELRGAIPIGISLGLSPITAAVISFIGSMIPVPLLLFSIRPVFNYLKKTKLFENVVHRITKRSIAKSTKVQKYGAWGLVLFVAIPLPGTGIWTGTLIAALLDIRFKWAFSAIFVGNLIAAAAVTGLSSGIIKVFS